MKRLYYATTKMMEGLAFRVTYLFANLIGEWDRTWTEDCRLCSVFGIYGIEHRAHDSVRTYAWGKGDITRARRNSDDHVDNSERLWANRTTDIELLSARRQAEKMMGRFSSNKAVVASIRRTLDVIEDEMLIRGLERKSAAIRKVG